MKWLILWSHEAASDLDRLGPEVADRVTNALDRLAIEADGDIRRLTGMDPPEYRLRVGKWRVRFKSTTRATDFWCFTFSGATKPTERPLPEQYLFRSWIRDTPRAFRLPGGGVMNARALLLLPLFLPAGCLTHLQIETEVSRGPLPPDRSRRSAKLGRTEKNRPGEDQ